MAKRTMMARVTKTAEFTDEELLVLIDASLNGNRIKEAQELLKETFGGDDYAESYMSGDEIQFYAYRMDPHKYDCGEFEDIDF